MFVFKFPSFKLCDIFPGEKWKRMTCSNSLWRRWLKGKNLKSILKNKYSDCQSFCLFWKMKYLGLRRQLSRTTVLRWVFSYVFRTKRKIPLLNNNFFLSIIYDAENILHAVNLKPVLRIRDRKLGSGSDQWFVHTKKDH